MSKKHRTQGFNQTSPQTTTMSHQEEYSIIKFDLIKVLVLNLVYLGAIIFLYLANQKSHILDTWFAKMLHF